MQNWIKISLGVLGTILLGAIGSGLWERFLSGTVDSVVDLSIVIVSSIFNSYKDGIYETASLGFHESYSLLLIMLFVMLMPLAYLRLLRMHPIEVKRRRTSENKVGDFIVSEKGYKFIFGLTITVMILCVFIISKISYTNRVVTYSMRSIDIVKPYISNNEYDLLKSQFYQVRNTDDYTMFNDKVKRISNKHNLKLPENEPL